jgi:FkbM family methyltransferase
MSMIRSVLEMTTRRWVLRRKMPSQFREVPIYVSPSAGLRYLFKPMNSIDPTLLSLAQELIQSGDVVWDIGANVGLFSTSAAALAGASGTVVAFEPDAWLVQLLRRTARAQPAGSAPITVVPTAIASDLAARTFMLARRSNATNFLEGYGTTQTGGTREGITVLAVTADWLLTQFAAPSFVKIDVEGAELEVLQGAKELFEKIRPVALIEVSQENAVAAAAFFRDRKYVLYDGEQPRAYRKPLDAGVYMTIAVPAV